MVRIWSNEPITSHNTNRKLHITVTNNETPPPPGASPQSLSSHSLHTLSAGHIHAHAWMRLQYRGCVCLVCVPGLFSYAHPPNNTHRHGPTTRMALAGAVYTEGVSPSNSEGRPPVGHTHAHRQTQYVPPSLLLLH